MDLFIGLSSLVIGCNYGLIFILKSLRDKLTFNNKSLYYADELNVCFSLSIVWSNVAVIKLYYA